MTLQERLEQEKAATQKFKETIAAYEDEIERLRPLWYAAQGRVQMLTELIQAEAQPAVMGEEPRT